MVNHFLASPCFPLMFHFSTLMVAQTSFSYNINLEEHQESFQAVLKPATEGFALSCQLFDV